MDKYKTIMQAALQQMILIEKMDGGADFYIEFSRELASKLKKEFTADELRSLEDGAETQYQDVIN